MSIALKVWAASDVGRVRQVNEDALCIGSQVVAMECGWRAQLRLDGDVPRLVAVVDGMGGHRGGAQASEVVARSLAGIDPNAEPSAEAAHQVLNAATASIHARSSRTPSLCGMGATVAALWFGSNGGVCMNVGDAKAFREQDGFLEQRSDDHVIMAPGGRRQLVQALGGSAELRAVEPAIREERARHGRRYLLCTDGLTDEVNLDELELAMALPPEQALEAMVSAARAAGGRDNITVAIVEIDTGEES